jgi:serine/threonine-protein kinase HipA
LAPAFDLNPNPSPGLKYLSTSIDGSDAPASLELAMGVAQFFRLSQHRSAAVLAEIVDAVQPWRDVASNFGLSKSEIANMEPAFIVQQ